jgi:hypothetical protein
MAIVNLEETTIDYPGQTRVLTSFSLLPIKVNSACMFACAPTSGSAAAAANSLSSHRSFRILFQCHGHGMIVWNSNASILNKTSILHMNTNLTSMQLLSLGNAPPASFHCGSASSDKSNKIDVFLTLWNDDSGLILFFGRRYSGRSCGRCR